MAGRRPCAAGIWLWSVGTAVSLSGAPRWDSSGAGAHRPVTAFGRSRRCYCWVGPLLACSRCGGRALRSAPPPDGRRRRIPTPPAVTRSGRGARLDSGYESGRRCGDPASSAAPRRTAASRARGERAETDAARSSSGRPAAVSRDVPLASQFAQSSSARSSGYGLLLRMERSTLGVAAAIPQTEQREEARERPGPRCR
jgi:hypothetical protein